MVSQFGHMFAPRPEVAVAEMRRVLKPTGRVAFVTWPPEHLVGRMFSLIGRNSPPPPPGVAPPPSWGNPAVINERLAGAFGEPFFERGTMVYPALSLAHYREFIEASIGPMRKVVEDSLLTSHARLANYKKAQENCELMGLEIDRLENTIHSLSELAVNRQEPEFITGQIDQVANSMVQTERTMGELQFVTGLKSADDEVPQVETQTYP